MSTVIQVENLSKYYRLGLIGGGTLREDVNRWVARLQGKPDPLLKIGQADHGNRKGDQIWALRDVSFEVKEGEILGIIGRNGAGKSTLLKILSRITAPTEGCIRIKGRVGSLLEVGTGFHPELTGRENIYLNGAILGMSRAEITSKFEEIVEFAEMGKFIDTPVKRYSSGMTVRLAFAVAAHLEPEILVIDEVLAVGDVEFQRKCLGKMRDVAGHGRTVLFVSHNLQSVQSLCNRAILLQKGMLVEDRDPQSVCAKYIAFSSNSAREKCWKPEIGNDWFLLHAIRVIQRGIKDGTDFVTSKQICVEIEFELKESRSNLCIGFDMFSADGKVLFRSYNTDCRDSERPHLASGLNKLICRIPGKLLHAGTYHIAPRIGEHNIEWIVWSEPVLEFTMSLDHGESSFWVGLNEKGRPGFLAPILPWESEQF